MNYINTKHLIFYYKKLSKKIHFSGVGVHSGRAVSIV